MTDLVIPGWVRTGVSAARFAPYLTAAADRVDIALRLYQWNTEISEAFYPALQLLEVGLRNALHDRMCAACGQADWWLRARLTDHGARKAAGAVASCRARKQDGVTPDDVVAELSFGFWVSLLSRGRSYDREFWVPTLHRAFPGYHGRRDQLHREFVSIVMFRNRVMHHERVHCRDLAADHASIHRLLGYLSSDFEGVLRAHDRVPEVLARRPAVSVIRSPTS